MTQNKGRTVTKDDMDDLKDEDARGRATSPYRIAEAQYEGDPEGFYRYLEDHRRDHLTLALGYWLLRAKRERNLNISDIASMMQPKPVSRGFLAAVLSGRSSIKPETMKSLADVLGISPLHFYIVMPGWIEPADVLDFQMDADIPEWHSVVQLITQIKDPDLQRTAAVVVRSVLETMLVGMRQSGNLPDPEGSERGGAAGTRSNAA